MAWSPEAAKSHRPPPALNYAHLVFCLCRICCLTSCKVFLCCFLCCTAQATALASIEFTIEYAREHLVALRHMQRALSTYREQHRGPCVATCQSPGGSEQLQRDMPLLGDFPCVDKPIAVEDGR